MSANGTSAGAPAQRHLDGTTAVVTGASRGLGRGAAAALTGAGARVLGVGRDLEALEKVRADLGGSFVPVRGDAADPDLAADLLTRHAPRTVVLAAGAAPVLRPLQEHTWDTFRTVWDTDVQQTFHWARAALREPLAPGSTVLSFSSGAALRGSPLSGGYAGAKATVRFVSQYAAAESRRQALGIRFVAVLPSLTPATGLGSEGVDAYAAYEGISRDAFVARLGTPLTPGAVGAAVLSLAVPAAEEPGDTAYTLSAAGLAPLAAS